MGLFKDCKKRLIPLLISFCLFLNSCGDISNEERVDNAISLANQLLTDKDCTAAKQVLDDLGYQNLNAEYLITYAASQACSGGYTTTNLFANELSKVGSTNAALLGSFTKFTTSSTSATVDASYNNILAAVNTLLYAGGISNPSHSERDTKFNQEDLQEIEVFTMYLMLTLMGKYFYIFGNTDSNGRKGSLDSTETNDCLIDYITADGQTARGAATNISPCAGNTSGHSEMESGDTNRKKYMCQGVVMFNNFLDVVTNVVISGSDTSSIQNLNDIAGTLCSTAVTGGDIDDDNVCNVTSQSICETTVWDSNSGSGAVIEQYFAFVFEKMLTDS